MTPMAKIQRQPQPRPPSLRTPRKPLTYRPRCLTLRYPQPLLQPRLLHPRRLHRQQRNLKRQPQRLRRLPIRPAHSHLKPLRPPPFPMARSLLKQCHPKQCLPKQCRLGRHLRIQLLRKQFLPKQLLRKQCHPIRRHRRPRSLLLAQSRRFPPSPATRPPTSGGPFANASPPTTTAPLAQVGSSVGRINSAKQRGTG